MNSIDKFEQKTLLFPSLSEGIEMKLGSPSRQLRDLITKKLRRLRIWMDSPGSFQTKKNITLKPASKTSTCVIHQKQTIDIYRL